MQIRYVIINVDDQDKALSFYTSIVGLVKNRKRFLPQTFSYGRLLERALASIFPGSSISRLNTRLKELSDPYPTSDATSENDVLFERIMAPALYICHCVRYSRGVWPQNGPKFYGKGRPRHACFAS
jgi:catechol 2,3-dioxygenase-like lactoylglutathione lyase family enzyme